MTRLFGRVRLCVVIVILSAPLAATHSVRAGGMHRIMQSPILPAPGGPVTLDLQQAEEVAVLMGFVRAYNGGRIGPALLLVGQSVRWSDCDYRRGIVITGRDKTSFTSWLHQRVADHDRLDVRSIEVGIDDEYALGITFARRRSDTLQALGHPHGIVPELSAKVLFAFHAGSMASPLIGGFANGPYGGSPAPCRV